MEGSFGITISSSSLGGLFNSCLDYLEYIELGHRYGHDYDYDVCQLKLDIANARLARCGEAVKIHEDTRFQTPSASNDPSAAATTYNPVLARLILEEIILLCESVRRSSKRYELVVRDVELFEEEDMYPEARALHNRLKNVVNGRREKDPDLVKQAAWVLYGTDSLERMVGQLIHLVDELEKAFSVEDTCRRLVHMVIGDMDDKASLTLLKATAAGIDAALADAATKKIVTLAAARNCSVDSQVDDFFNKTSASRKACDARAREVVGDMDGVVVPVDVQGMRSYTVYAGPELDIVVQFRLESLAPNTSLATKIYGSLVPKAIYGGRLSGEREGKRESLLVYLMGRIRGMTHSDFILAHGFPENSPDNILWRRNLMGDVAQ